MVLQKTNSKSPTKGNKITSYFTPKNENSTKNVPTTKCPLCNCPATIKEVNQHLDSGCPIPIDKIESDDRKNPRSAEKYIEHMNHDSIKPQLNTANESLCNVKFHENHSRKNASEKFESNKEKIKEMKHEKQNVTYRATNSVSSSPSKRNNLNVVTKLSDPDSKLTSILLSPTKSSHKLHYSSPTKQTKKVMKQLFNKANGSSSQNQNNIHTPLSPSKKQDPKQIPYYLANFEAVLRGVLEETEDGELFLPEEKEYVDKFRNLSINERKLYVRLFQRKNSWLQVRTLRFSALLNSM